uniref:Proton-coupled zinc antiporter SLC30A9, mitochondrial n=1 Tax=Phallusia mammillata TaxID=59560 RepID=A0A6F9DSS4_9ASCI|nr:zinc transporter 9-like [Phallusia mammillata]
MFSNPLRHTVTRCAKFWKFQQSLATSISVCTISTTPTFQNETKSPDDEKDQKDSSGLVSTMKKYILKRRDYSKKFTDNNTITAIQAMQDYILSPGDLDGLQQIRVRSPYVGSSSPIMVYLERDVEERAIKIWGSREALEREQKRFQKLHSKNKFSNTTEKTQSVKRFESLLGSGQGKVVAYAAVANATIGIFKFGCFLASGSASMFSETLHSLADTCNQLLLLWGVNESLKNPDAKHPYGYGNMRHIMALISGVGIFCIGCGASVYHGVQVLLHPQDGLDLASLSTFGVLLGSSFIEAASLVIAIQETRKNAKKHNLDFWNYVNESRDPSTNVVLLEDSAAVLGIFVAGGALALTHITGNVMYDAIGSIVIGGLLGTVATFLVTTNVNALIGRSIPQERMENLKEALEDDVCVRGVYDVKATQLGSDEFKFKAEIDFDGREITRAYLASVDMEQVMHEINSVKTMEELEQVLLRYGEHVIDTLGVQIDRIETELKKKHSDLRHIDLEVL